MTDQIGLDKCKFNFEIDCLKERCPFWLKLDDGEVCGFDVASNAIPYTMTYIAGLIDLIPQPVKNALFDFLKTTIDKK